MAPYVGAMRLRSYAIPPGDFGTTWTLAHMRGLVNASLTDPDIRGAAARIVRAIDPHRRREQAYALRRWLEDHIRFLRDPAGLELLHEPRVMLQSIYRSGHTAVDCDDAAILAAALGKAIGFPARFVVAGFGGGDRVPFTHVWTELGVNPTTWIEMDVTRESQELTALITRRLVQAV